MAPDESEHELIARAVAGEEPALFRLLHSHYDRLAAHIAAKMPAFLRSVTDPADILQETFVQAWRHIRNFQPSGDGAFHAWLVTIADRKLLDRIKSHHAQKHGGGQVAAGGSGDVAASSVAELLDVLEAEGDSPSKSAMRHELVQALHLALAALPDDYREGIQLRYIQGLSVAEVAERMNRTERANSTFVEAL